jgi:hypothetical protein
VASEFGRLWTARIQTGDRLVYDRHDYPIADAPLIDQLAKPKWEAMNRTVNALQ